jgi:hypothetical protein
LCGILAHGFLCLRCGDGGHHKLVLNAGLIEQFRAFMQRNAVFTRRLVSAGQR